MKWLVAVVVLVLVCVGYIVMSGGDEPVESTPASATAPSDEETGAGDAAGDATSDPARIATAEELKTEIEDLMAEYDRYRDDPVKREAIQAEMDVLMREYNDTVLPIAVEKVKEGN